MEWRTTQGIAEQGVDEECRCGKGERGARAEAGFLQGSSKAPPRVWDRRRQGESFLPRRRFGLGEQARLELGTGRLSGVGVIEVGVAGRGVNPRFRCEGHVDECGW